MRSFDLVNYEGWSQKAFRELGGTTVYACKDTADTV